MTSDPKLDVALKILKDEGHHIGKEHIAPPEQDGTMRIWIDDLPCTFEAVFKKAEEADADAELRREVQMHETAKQLLDAAINAHMAIYARFHADG